jgi:hypothetical protein
VRHVCLPCSVPFAQGRLLRKRQDSRIQLLNSSPPDRPSLAALIFVDARDLFRLIAANILVSLALGGYGESRSRASAPVLRFCESSEFIAHAATQDGSDCVN